MMNGEVRFIIESNVFSDSESGCLIENTGDQTRNHIVDNAFNSLLRASSVFGKNDAEYLVNCFSETGSVDIEVNEGASISESQGDEDNSAGNCFEDGARIQTSTGAIPFIYWTKDGYNSPTVCEYPGSGNFTIELATNETDHDDCGPQSPYANNISSCSCSPGENGCITSIAAIRSSITSTESNQSLSAKEKELLIAEYHRCLDDLMRQYVRDVLGRGDAENVIDYLSAQPEFRYRIMAYGIMHHNLEYDRAIGYLDTLSVTTEEEQDFIEAQEIYLDFAKDIAGFVLSSADSMVLLETGEKFNPFAGYARSIYYLLTRQWIEREFIHLDSTVVPRSNSNPNPSMLQEMINVAPNPTSENTVTITIDNFNADTEYSVSVLNTYGVLITSQSVTSESQQVELNAIPGIYFFMIKSKDRVIGTTKVIRL
jgi:hypothetical protein